MYYIIFNYIQYIYIHTYIYIYIYTLYIILAGDIDDFNSSCDLVWIMFTKYTAHPANLHSDPCHGLWASHGSQLILTYGGTKAHSKAYIGHTHVYIIYSLYIYLYIYIDTYVYIYIYCIYLDMYIESHGYLVIHTMCQWNRSFGLWALCLPLRQRWNHPQLDNTDFEDPCQVWKSRVRWW